MRPTRLLLLTIGLVGLAACQTSGGSGVAPAAAAPGAEGPISRYLCSDGAALSARFGAGRDAAVVSRGGGFSVTLPSQRPASGIWYGNDAYELRGQGAEVTFGKVGEDQVVCRVVG